MNKLARAVALVALAAVGAGCTQSTEADDEEEVETTVDALRAKPTGDPGDMIAKLKPSNGAQTVKARFSLPSWHGYLDNPMAIGCQYVPQRFDMKIEVAKVTARTVRVKSIRINYDTSIGPAAVFAFDSGGSETFTYGADDFLAAGDLGQREPGDSDRMNVNRTFKLQQSGEGTVVEFRLADSALLVGGSTCVRTARVVFQVKR